MATTPELLALSKQIATKARGLIPRSSNRSIYGAASMGDLAQDSEWRNAPTYVSLQIKAQRARGRKNKYRWLVDQVNRDLAMHSDLTEEAIDRRVRLKLSQLGYSPSELFQQLNSAKRSHKTHHSNSQAVLPFEVQEAAAKNAVRYRVGNCGENASLAYVMFAEYTGPRGDLTLPDLDLNVGARPLVEKIAATVADHAFVVVNRPQVPLDQTNSWLLPDTIICDPWWFHTGDAFVATNRVGEYKGLLEFIEGDKDNLAVSGAAVRLGRGHSARFANKTKYNDLNYWLNPATDTENLLRRPVWQADSDATNCPLCNKLFFAHWWGPRKHHCRKCGRVVCDDCSKQRRIVRFPATDPDSVPSPSSGGVRVCDDCL